MKEREFVRKVSHKIKDIDIKDLKSGLVSILVVHNIPLSQKSLLEQLNRIGNLQRQDISGDFINIISFKKATNGMPWHTDRSYHSHPPQFVALYALSVPEENKGGATLYCDLQKAYQGLSKEMIKKLNHLYLLHLNKYMLDPKSRRKYARRFLRGSAVHPLIQSDETGKYLFFNWDYTDDFPLKEKLCRHVYQMAHIYKHQWSPFDLIISNNLKTNHRREENLDLESPRTLWRFHLSSK